MKPPVPRVLLITDHQVCPDLETAVTAALRGGVTHLLLRMKRGDDPSPGEFGNASMDQIRHWAERLQRVTQPFQAHLLISAHLEVALPLQGVGLHLPEGGISTAQARSALGAERLLGRSCHDLSGARRAFRQGADYVTLSPLFATASHPEAQPLGLDRFSSLCSALPGPVLALGGMDAENISQARQSGAYGVALIRAILASPFPEKAAREIVKRVG